MRFTIQDVEDVQTDVKAIVTGRFDRVAHMVEHFGLPWNFVNSKLNHLLKMSPIELLTVIQYQDPTGETATDRAMRQVAA